MKKVLLFIFCIILVQSCISEYSDSYPKTLYYSTELKVVQINDSIITLINRTALTLKNFNINKCTDDSLKLKFYYEQH